MLGFAGLILDKFNKGVLATLIYFSYAVGFVE
jgi:hypothetical protein